MKKLITVVLFVLFSCLSSSALDITAGSEYVFNPGTIEVVDVAKLDDTHVVIVYKDVTEGSIGKAIIGTISGTTITYGSEYTFNSGITRYVSVAALSSSKFVVSFRDQTNNNYGTAMIGEVSGTTINFGAEYVFNADSQSYITVDAMSSSKFAVAYRDDGSSYYGTAVIGEVSGTTISYGSEYVFNNSGSTDYTSVVALSDSKIAVVYEDRGNSNYGTAIIGEVSGTVISYGLEYAFNAGSSIYTTATALSQTKLAVAYCDEGNSFKGTAAIGNISGTVISFGYEYMFNNGSSNMISIDALTEKSFVVSYQDDANSDKGTTVIGSVSDKLISFGPETLYNDANTHENSVAGLTTTSFVVAYMDYSNSYYGSAAVCTVPDEASYLWAFRFGQTSNDRLNGMAIDNDGNIIITGHYAGTVDFDPSSAELIKTCAYCSEIFFAKYNKDMELQWANTIVSSSCPQGMQVDTDDDGNVYVGGGFYDSGDFDPGAGTVTLTGTGYEGFVGKYDSDGAYVWAFSFGSTTNEDYVQSIELGPDGYLYVSGKFEGTVDFDPSGSTNSLTSTGGAYNSFLAKYTTDGDFVWVKGFGLAQFDYPQNMAVSEDDDIYFSMSFQGTVDFDPNDGTTNLTSAGNYDIACLKISANGALQWAKGIGSTGNDYARAIGLDQTGNAIYSISFEGTVDFDPGTGTTEFTSAGSGDIALCKFNPSGGLIWAKQISGTENLICGCVETDPSNRIVISGSLYGTADFDPGAGTANLTSAGDGDGFVAMYDSDGSYIWAFNYGGTGYDYQYSHDIDGKGNIYTSSMFSNTVDFDIGGGTAPLTSAGGQDCALVKFSYNIEPAVTTNTASSITHNSVNLSGEVTSEGSSDVSCRGFYYNTTGSPKSSDNVAYSGSGTGSFSKSIDGLKPNTTYYARAYATNSVGTSYADVISFITDKYSSGLYYSGTARSTSGALLQNQYIGIKCEIRKRSDDDLVFQETHTVSVDNFGNYSFELGSGEVTTGGMDALDVSSYNYYVLIFVDDSAPYSSYSLVESKDFMSLVIKSSGISSATSGLASTSGQGQSTGELKSFSSYDIREGWTYTGQSESIGSPDTWSTTNYTNSPGDLVYTQMIWTGEDAIIWGGYNGSSIVNGGYKYNPGTDSWTEIATNGQPSARQYHHLIWTGEEMIVWGGENGSNLNNGAIYNPQTDSWRAMSTPNAPAVEVANSDNFAVWTGEEMIVWGGRQATTYTNEGGRYNPSTDTWTAMNTDNAPSARYSHRMLWTGDKMFVWGGYDGSSYLNTGALYDPGTDTWTTISTTNAPAGRTKASAVWTGDKVLIWGGTISSNSLATGAAYDPDTDTWTTITTTSAPSIRRDACAAWTGSEMIIWGGAYDYSPTSFRSDGALYNPSTDSWTALTTTNAPSSRASCAYTWTGDKLIIYSGWYGSPALRGDGAVLSGSQCVYWYKKD